jgi:molybdenum cofactor cytidylyltransferase
MRNIGAVVLAAGGSSRLGQAKQLLAFRGETLIRRVVRAAAEAGCNPIVVVVGEIGDAIRHELDATRATFVENADWQRGIGTSIRRGLREIIESDAVVLLTCDQPFVDCGVIARLFATQQETGKPIIASNYANTLGVPALFARSCFDALLALPDDTGAKKLIEEQAADVASIRFEDGAIDIDTPEDFERLKQNRG